MEPLLRGKKLPEGADRHRCPLAFRKCANGTLLPLTLLEAFARMKAPKRKSLPLSPRGGMGYGWTDHCASDVGRAGPSGSSPSVCQQPARCGRQAIDRGGAQRKPAAGEFTRENVSGIRGARRL